jgi:hypothetical protein
LIAAAVLAGACGKTSAPAQDTDQKAAPHAQTDTRLLQELSLLASGGPASKEQLDRWQADIASGKATLPGYVDWLLRQRAFFKDVAPQLIMLTSWSKYLGGYSVMKGFVLKQEAVPVEGSASYYLRKPCKPEETEAVHPWWNLAATVRVCSEAYRPKTFWYSYPTQHCSAFPSAPGVEAEPRCGCGPNLMRCFPNQEVYDDAKAQLLDEVRDTISYAVERDLPIDQVFLMNESLRKPYAELVYNIWRVERGEIASVPDIHGWPKEGKLAPRQEPVPGDHAGVLTTSASQWDFTGTRPQMRAIQETMWCSPADSSKVGTDVILSIGKVGSGNLRAGEGWKALASHAVCTNCHARMDYASQFFMGFPDSRSGTFFAHPKPGLPLLQGSKPTATEKVYVNDISDLRGEAPLSPLGWAQVAVKQPEFANCQVQKVLEYVLGSTVAPENRAALNAIFKSDRRLTPLVRAALLLYAKNYTERSGAAPDTEPAVAFGPATTSTGDHVDVSSDLRADLDRNCVDCHDERTPERDFQLERLPRAMVYQMLTHVSVGIMPKTFDGLPQLDRRRLISELVSSLWQDRVERETANQYFTENMDARTLNPIGGAFALVRARAGAQDRTKRTLLESGVTPGLVQYSPGFVAASALEALKVCRSQPNLDEAALVRCIERATNPDGLIRP